MAFYSGRNDGFENTDLSKVSGRVKKLYRIRDNDKSEFKGRGDYQPFFVSIDSGVHTNYIRMFSINYCDPKWEKLNEEERIENGLPTKYLLLHKTQSYLFLSTLFACIYI